MRKRDVLFRHENGQILVGVSSRQKCQDVTFADGSKAYPLNRWQSLKWRFLNLLSRLRRKTMGSGGSPEG